MRTSMAAVVGRQAGRAVARLVLVLVIGLSAAGCVMDTTQRDAVARFGAAAADLGTIAADEFVQSRADVIEMNTRRLGLGDRTVDANRLDSYFTLEDVQARVYAAEALHNYGVLLSKLAGSDDRPAIAAAATQLVSSLQRLNAAGRLEISDERLGTIGRAVAGLGGLAVEGERARVIREVVDAASPAVRRVAELVRRDFDPGGDHWSVGYEAAALKLAERAANVRADLGDPPPDRRAEWVAAETALAEAEALRGECMQRFDEVSSRITRAAEALLLAEQDVRGSLVSPAFGVDDLDRFADEVAELITTYRILRR